MRRAALALALGACTPTHPKPAQQATPAEAPVEAKAEAKAEPVAAPVEAKAETVAAPEPAAPVVPATREEAPVDPRDIAARRAASPPSLVEPGRFHLAAYADDSKWIEVDVLGDAVALRAPAALAVAEPGAAALRSEPDWVRGLDGLEWTWEPVAFHDDPNPSPTPLSRAFGGRWPDDVYFATAHPGVESDFPPPDEDPVLLYKFAPEGWAKTFPETPEAHARMNLYYGEFVPWREGQVLAAQVWHFDKLGFEIDSGLGYACDREEGEEDGPHRKPPKPPKSPRQKFVVFGDGKAPMAPKGGVARLAASSRRTLYAFDGEGTPSRRVPGQTKWEPLPRPDGLGLPRELAVAADDTLYAPLCGPAGCAVMRLRGETWTREPLPDGVRSIRGLVIDARDDLWIAGDDALWRRRASLRPPVAAGTPTDRSAEAPLEPAVAEEEVIEPWERVALPGVRMPALALPRAVFGEQPGDYTWEIRPERTDMAEKTHAIEIRALRARGDELWISGAVDGASVVLTTRALAPFAFPDLYVASPNDYLYPDVLKPEGCPAVALRLGAVAPDAPDDPRLLAALADSPRDKIAVVVAADPRELVAVWTGELDVVMPDDEPQLATPAQLATAKAGLTALGTRLTELGVVKQAELACWAPAVARVITLPP